MSEHLEHIAELIRWLKDSTRPAFVLFVVSGAMLLLPKSWLASLGMVTWIQSYKPWTVIIFALSLVWLATYPFAAWHHQYKTIERIRYLAQEERYLLSRFVQADSAVECFGWRDASSASSLIRDTILFETGSRDRSGNPYIAIDPWVFQYLRKHKEFIESKSKP